MATSISCDMADMDAELAVMPLPQQLQQRLKIVVDEVYAGEGELTHRRLFKKMVQYDVPDNLHLKALSTLPSHIRPWSSSGRRCTAYIREYSATDTLMHLTNSILPHFRPKTPKILRWVTHIGYMHDGLTPPRPCTVNCSLFCKLPRLLQTEFISTLFRRQIKAVLKSTGEWHLLRTDKPFEIAADGDRLCLYPAYELDETQKQFMTALSDSVRVTVRIDVDTSAELAEIFRPLGITEGLHLSLLFKRNTELVHP